jgi:hypothetical protein
MDEEDGRLGPWVLKSGPIDVLRDAFRGICVVHVLFRDKSEGLGYNLSAPSHWPFSTNHSQINIGSRAFLSERGPAEGVCLAADEGEAL